MIEQIKKELAEWDDLIVKRPELKGMCGKWPEWVRSLIDEAEEHKRQAEEKEELLQHASRIIDSGMGAGILRYDPVQWFINYHKHKKGATK